jgi:purine-binding chemotaxis protein CheW
MSSTKLDWEAIWKSLNWGDETRQAEMERLRLRQRARQYATPLAEPTTVSEDSETVLKFELGGEHYGVDVIMVRGVRAAPRITPVPGTPVFYRGVINLRGQIITVLDLRLFFGFQGPETVSLPGEMVIVQAGGLQLALLAKQIQGVVSLAPGEINAVENLPYALGITGDRTIILNMKQLFEDERLVVGAEA